MSAVDVSIVMVAYNQEKYLRAAIDSILSQRTEYRYELLIGDDCSSDRSPDIIAEYAGRYPEIIRPVLRKANIGAARNGYELDLMARGRYIAYCEGDDCWYGGGRLQRQVDFLDRHPEYSAVCDRCRLIDDKGQELPVDAVPEWKRFWMFDKKEFGLEDFEKWRMPGHISSVLARNVFLDRQDRSIVYRAHTVVADRTHILFFALNGPICCSDEVGSCYRLRTDATGHNFMSQYQTGNYRYEDYRMMQELERYARDHSPERIDLSLVKRERFAAAVAVWLKDRTRDNWKAVAGIIRESGSEVRYVALFVRVAVQKWFYLHVLKKDKRVKC